MSKSDRTTFVKSVDSLFGHDIASVDCPWFSAGPPLVLGAKNDQRSLKLLKQKCRLGLPPQLRCASKSSCVGCHILVSLPTPFILNSCTQSYDTQHIQFGSPP